MVVVRSPWILALISFPLLGLVFVEMQVHLLQANIQQYKTREEPSREFTEQFLQSFDKKDDHMMEVVLYNRIPKTGSTTFTNFIYDSCKKNRIYVLHVNTTKNSHIMSLQDQYSFVRNISTWHEMRPAFFHGHFAYIDFKHFGSLVAPQYINIIRDPLERLISYYYFLRYGDDYRKGLKRDRQGDKTTFDECVINKGNDCAPEKLWLQIPFFCGQMAECWKPGSQWALDEAKHNIVNNYMLVGITDQMEEFIVVLEATMPRLFSGLTEMIREGSKAHIRKTLHKDLPAEDTIKFFQHSHIWQMENEFYLFAKEQFEFVKKQSTLVDSSGRLIPAPKRYRYEKIRGPILPGMKVR